MIWYNIWIFAVNLWLVLISLASTQKLCQTLDSACLSQIDDFVKTVMKCRHVPGLSLSIVKDSPVTEGLSRGYGFAEVRKRSPVTNTTKFPIGALTKAFTSSLVSVMLSREKDRYVNKWDTTVKKILGDNFRLNDDWRTGRTTLRDLAAHKLGLHTYYLPLLAGLDGTHQIQEYCRRLGYLTPAADFRTRFILSDYPYILLGCTIEKMGQGSYAELLTSSILDPLGMTSTNIEYGTERSDEAVSYIWNKGKFDPLDSQLSRPAQVTVAALGLLSSGTDMMKWMKFHLHGDKQLLGIDGNVLEETYEAQIAVTDIPTTAQKPFFPFTDKVYAYNMGWLSGIYRGYSYLEHGGLTAGFGAHLRLFKEGNVGVYVNVNGPQYRDAALARYTIIWYISDLLLGLDPVLNTTNACNFPPGMTNTRPPGPVVQFPESYHLPADTSFVSLSPGPESCDAVLGKYGHPLFGNVTVVHNKESSTLNIQIGTLGLLNLQANSCGNYTGVFLSPIDALFEQRKQVNEVQIYFSNSDTDGLYSEVTLRLPDSTFEAPITYTRGLHWDEQVLTGPLSPTTSPILEKSCNNAIGLFSSWKLIFLSAFLMLYTNSHT